jgi:hypothetical protein
LQCISDKIFVLTAGGISIPKGLNQNILQFLTGKDLLRFKMVTKKAEMIVEHCHHALIYDTIHERLRDLLDELNIDQSRRISRSMNISLRQEIVCAFMGKVGLMDIV